jgi:hypothetical protein
LTDTERAAARARLDEAWRVIGILTAMIPAHRMVEAEAAKQTGERQLVALKELLGLQ